jgi:hypothetical protein
MTIENPWKPSVKKGQPQGYHWDLADALVRIGIFTPESPQTFTLNPELRRRLQAAATQRRNASPKKKPRTILNGAILIELMAKAPQPVKAKHLIELASMTMGALRQHIELLLENLRKELSEATPTDLLKLDRDHEVAEQLAAPLFLENRKKPQLHELLNQNYTFDKWLEQWMAAPEESEEKMTQQ